MLKAKNILLLSEDSEQKRLEFQNPLTQFVEIKKIYPSTLRIALYKSEPLAELRLSQGYALLNRDGKILLKQKERTPTLPLITYYQLFDYNLFQSGDKVNYSEIVTALFFIDKLNNLNVKVESIDINGSSVIVCNLRDKRIFISNTKDKDQQLFELTTIIKQFKIKAQNYKEIDVRFDKPIVRF